MPKYELTIGGKTFEVDAENSDSLPEIAETIGNSLKSESTKSLIVPEKKSVGRQFISNIDETIGKAMNIGSLYPNLSGMAKQGFEQGIMPLTGSFVPGGRFATEAFLREPQKTGLLASAIAAPIPTATGFIGSKIGETLAPEDMKNIGSLAGGIIGGGVGIKPQQFVNSKINKALTNLRTPEYLKEDVLLKDTQTINNVIKDFRKNVLGKEYQVYEDYGNVSVPGKSSIIDMTNKYSKTAGQKFKSIVGKKTTPTISDIKEFMSYLDDGVKPDKNGRTLFSTREVFEIKNALKDNHIFPALDKLSPELANQIRKADNMFREYGNDARMADAISRDSAVLRKILTDPTQASKRNSIYKILKASESLPDTINKSIKRIKKRNVIEQVGETFMRGAEAGAGSRVARTLLGAKK